MGVGGRRHAPVALPQRRSSDTHCAGGWVDPTAGLDGCEEAKISGTPGVRTPDRPVRIVPQYRLLYTGAYLILISAPDSYLPPISSLQSFQLY